MVKSGCWLESETPSAMDMEQCAAPRTQIVPKTTHLTPLEQHLAFDECTMTAWSEPTTMVFTTSHSPTHTKTNAQTEVQMNTQTAINQETPSSADSLLCKAPVDSLFVCSIPHQADDTSNKPTTVSPVDAPQTVNIESKNAKSFFCDVCSVSCNSETNFKKHKEGKKHLKKTENLPVSSAIMQKTAPSIWCELCGNSCNSRDQFDIHILGRKHKNKAKRMLQDPKESKDVFAERGKRKLANDDSLASDEDPKEGKDVFAERGKRKLANDDSLASDEDPKEGKDVFAERCKRKLANDDSLASDEDADTNRLKMVKGEGYVI